VRGSKQEFGPILATREMSWIDVDGTSHTGYVDVSEPIENCVDGEIIARDYYCNVRLRNLGDEATERAYGCDEFQAIYLGLVLAGSKVSTCGFANFLDWSKVPNFGFPEPPQQTKTGGGCK
jgi:hypothetical protein